MFGSFPSKQYRMSRDKEFLLPIEHPARPHDERRPAIKRPKFKAFLHQLLLVTVGWYLAQQFSDRLTDAVETLRHLNDLPHDGQVDMSTVPIGKLIEHQCWPDTPGHVTPKEMQCYRMAAPLDYTNSSDTRRASIALVKYPAGGGKTPRSKVLGSVFMNPGGPGGSGIDFVTRNSSNYAGSSAVFFDALFESRYDVMSFDPRGVQRTWPRADCFNDSLESYGDATFMQGGGLLHSSSSAAPRAIAHNNLLAGLCLLKQGDVLPYVSTAAVVKDLNLMRQAVGDEKLNYNGYSYGTVLGSYFADIFPQYVGHFWLDGVADVFNYQQGLWSNNLVDFEDVLRGYFSTCVDAGPDHCALAATIPRDVLSGDKQAAKNYLAKNFNDQLEALRTDPVPVPDSEFPGLSTYINFKNAYFQAMYAPSKWPALANATAVAQSGKWAPFVNEYGLERFTRPIKGTFASPEGEEAIACADATDRGKEWKLHDYLQHEKDLEVDSPFGAEIWIDIGAMCQGAWKIQAKDVWRGSFNSTPATPILFGSNKYDPVTPLRAARKVRDSFAGPNKLFQVEGYGHCTIASPSRCAQKIVADYFVRDKLPDAKETVCQVEAAPFMPPAPPLPPHQLAALSQEERASVELMDGARAAAEAFGDWRREKRLPL